MNITIDARGINWYKGTGIGTYTENLLKNLLTIDKENKYKIFWSGDNYSEYIQENSQVIMCSRKYQHFFEENFFPSNLNSTSPFPDLYHVPQNGIGLNSSIVCKKIVTIHDLIPYIMPETVGRGYLLKFLKEMPYIIECAEKIITVSEYSKKDILRFFPIDPDKVSVVHLAADTKYKPLDKEKCKEYLKNKYGIDKKFILYLGGFSERKNVSGLITAFSNAMKHSPCEYNLIIVGGYRDASQSLLTLVDSLGMKDLIKFTGFAPEEELPIYYNACEAFVYPSLYEGFGLPPLEAMNCGTPVITSSLTSIPEVVKDAGILIDPHNSMKLQAAIELILSSEELRTKYSNAGLQRSKEFSWERVAKQTLDIYTQINTSQN